MLETTNLSKTIHNLSKKINLIKYVFSVCGNRNNGFAVLAMHLAEFINKHELFHIIFSIFYLVHAWGLQCLISFTVRRYIIRILLQYIKNNTFFTKCEYLENNFTGSKTIP
jgi:uncharacterized protein (DUF486 family)